MFTYIAKCGWAVFTKFSMSLCIFLYIFVYIYAQFYTLYKYIDIYIRIKILSINPVMAQQNVNLKEGEWVWQRQQRTLLWYFLGLFLFVPLRLVMT